ncbi:MAG: glucosamine-6-phosphate deaminase [Bacteroidetes bacterium]|nr:MAG: glucosamine-6-phosphate deaminase [Bacteroidota bacterium]
MTPKVYNASSSVETYELSRSKHASLYPPAEKINVIEVENFPLLGRLTALRFIEWAQKNPGGVISLPTGKTPEHFIKWVRHILSAWKTKETQQMLDVYGINPSQKPEMRSLSFVQIDEFYPINSSQHNSFYHYVNEMYIEGFGLSLEKARLIDTTSLGLPPGMTMKEVFPENLVDLTLRIRKTTSELERLQKNVINRVDEFCMEYEAAIREMGGIGFFLGGIGPDGHIAFNVRGSSFYSVTRLTGTNYETQAAAATDLGGMEISRNHLVITIGLSTITYNPTCTAIIMASGDAKANVVAHAIQREKNPQYPASVLQELEHARFYLTGGAASELVERKYYDVSSSQSYSDELMDEAIITLSLRLRKPLLSLTLEDFSSDNFTSLLISKTGTQGTEIALNAHHRIIAKIEKGLQHVSGTTFLHTEPHHDDIMLGYLAHLYHLVRDATNLHYFANLTSGFTAVTNAYVVSTLVALETYINDREMQFQFIEGYFKPDNITGRMADVYLYLDGIASKNEERIRRAEAYRLLRNLVEVYHINDNATLPSRILQLRDYFNAQYPGAKDPQDIQTLKGTFREFEVELLWAYFGIETSSIRPLRLGFYTGDIFTAEPEIHRDALPIFEYMKEIQPDVVSVAFDPEGSGPDTHYKALQAVAGALKMYREHDTTKGVRIWGYRNVWYRFKPAEANLFVPVSLNSLSMLHTAFMNCFGSQRAASFPSYEHDGPFSELAQKIQVEQYEMLKTCLGNDFFLRNSHPRLRAARGFIFLKEMELEEFFGKVRELKKRTEAKEF